MARLTYAHHLDVVRRFDPRMEEADLLGEDFVGDEDVEVITSRLEGVEAKWDRLATPMRPVRIGSIASPIYEDAKGKPWPVTIYLDHQNVVPLDSAAGDFIERRTGRDSYTDMTSLEGEAWVADYRTGTVTIYRHPGFGALPAFHHVRDKFVKLSYRVAGGGDLFQAGQTTLAEELSQGDTTTVSVAEADRLPTEGETMFVGGEEYIHVSDVDRDSDEVTVAERGLRKTSDTTHASGTVVHYCPMDVREAIAAYAAVELAVNDDVTQWLLDAGSVDFETKIEMWEQEFHQAVGAYTTRSGYN